MHVVQVQEPNEPEDDNFDHLFTPEVIAKIDAASAEADAGKLFTLDEVNERLDALRDEWLASHPR